MHVRRQRDGETFALAWAAAIVGGRHRRSLGQRIDERAFRMSTAKRQTMSKMNRERELREKRALKQERKDQKKLAAAAAAAIEAEAPVAAPSA
jgi:hypothetical protein